MHQTFYPFRQQINFIKFR